MQSIESAQEEGTTTRPLLRGDENELRAMKRALASAPLGPKAVLALTSAILAIESGLGEPASD